MSRAGERLIAAAKGLSTQFAGRGATHEKGGGPEGRPQGKTDMLSVVEKPVTGKQKAATSAAFHQVSDVRKAALWLDEQSEKAKSGVLSLVADLTPDIAAVLLERNPSNRTLKHRKVQDYAHDIKAGAWKFNGEPIIVADDGLLNDGQHRAAAVIESQTAIPVLMVFGVERETRDTLDQGVNRAASDYLSMRGYTNQHNLAAMARYLWQWRTYGVVTNKDRSPTRSEILDTVEANQGLVKSLDFVNRKNARVLRSVSVLGFCHFAFKAVGSARDDGADFFMEALIDGTDLKAGNPILMARNRMIAERKQFSTPEKAELLFRAWNAYRLGQTRVIFRLTGGELPMLEA